MFDTILIITLSLLASLLLCLLTLRLSISVKHFCLFFHSLPILTGFFKFRPPPPFILTPCLLNLTKISDPIVYFDPPFIRYLRVIRQINLVFLLVQTRTEQNLDESYLNRNAHLEFIKCR